MNIRELQEFFDQSQDIVALVDRDLRYEAANLQYCRYWGERRDRLLATDLPTVVGGSMDAGVRRYLARCLEGHDVVFERWQDFPGAGLRHMDVRYTPRRDDSGEVTGVFLIARDTTERMKLQAAVLAERDKLDQILSALKVGLMLLARDLSIEWVNDHLRSMFPDREPIGASCYRFLMNSSRRCPGCPALETMSSGEVCTTETYLEDSDRTFVLTTVPLPGPDGEVDRVLCHVMDVTGQRKSMQALRKREAELNSIFRATRVGIGVVKDRVITQANDHFFDMLGYSKEELLGSGSRKVYATEEAYQKAGQEAYGAMSGDKTVALETQWRRKDGTVLDVLVTITFLNPDNPFDGATFVAMDITDRKRVEEAIRESEQRFRNIFEDVTMIAVQGYDRDRRVVYWNPASEELYGYTRDEAMGKLLEELIIPEPMRDMVKAMHREWVRGGPPIPPGELELVHKDGSPVPVYSSHVMQDTSRGEKFMYCVDVGLAEIKRIHNRLVRAKEEAEAANRAKSEFLANMSHEIRTPLNGIKGMLSLMKMTPLDDVQAEYAQAGIDSATRLNRLLSDILDLSRVEAGKLTLEMEMFNLPTLLRQLEGLFRPLFDEKGLTLACSVASDVPEYVIGDSARLHQVLTNLVGNGLKYTDKGGVRLDAVRVEAHRPGVHRVLFSVSDTGIGIEEDVLQSLFEPFIQGSRGYTRKYQGAGLGLSICRRLVTLMGGTLAVESEPGRGSTFYASIPFDQDLAAADIRAEEASDSAGVAVQLRVLLAEDDRVNSMVGQRMLERAGCSVEAVGNGALALDALRREKFAAVFMDVQMPDMDGVEATRHIRAGLAGEENRDIPIFALTAYTMAGDRERFLECGMDGYVPKPVEGDDILRALRVAVKKRRSGR
ncbi:PAS domain-containing hybrid sensor histidine kinase/response regulator [Pseudodesulfovibrio portus]|uniref:histidine kinase n=1 Tax=Pseudodesulfovibrio portus TaxID=231439 RepID=A0ABM8ATV6_9BACT|nr:PAS domain S-box protein [Pseudodesulfovibrio portus]BDQ34867.1 hypothetical protein JCM14722_24090 [Pseudodesulfovibrio portus]